MAGESGATVNRHLNSLQFALANQAADAGTITAGDRIPIARASLSAPNDYRIDYCTPDELRQIENLALFIAAGSTLTVTQALHHGKIIKLDTASGSVCTLPAAAGTGARYRFVISVIATTNSHVIKVANASDTMAGLIWSMSDDPATVKAFAASGTGGGGSDTITLNRSTTGSTLVGEDIELIDFATNLWIVRGWTGSTGTEATPFSAGV